MDHFTQLWHCNSVVVVKRSASGSNVANTCNTISERIEVLSDYMLFVKTFDMTRSTYLLSYIITIFTILFTILLPYIITMSITTVSATTIIY